MENIFFTADTHFGHANVLKHCKRPFADVGEMNETLVRNWNAVVPKGALTYVLGDMLWKPDEDEDLIGRLNGQIFLVKGSHDRYEMKHKKIVKVERLHNFRIDDQPITLCHFCMRVWHLSHFNSFHLFGHSHGRLAPIGKSMDVGVDAQGYFPVSWAQVKAIMATRPDNANYIDGKRRA